MTSDIESLDMEDMIKANNAARYAIDPTFGPPFGPSDDLRASYTKGPERKTGVVDTIPTSSGVQIDHEMEAVAPQKVLEPVI